MRFDPVVDEYDAARPGYPAAVYDALGPLDGRTVIDGGAGTGIASRALLERGAVVFPFDLGEAMLRRAAARSPGLPAVLADGGALPYRDRCADLLCFAQSWHWLPPETRVHEAARVLRAAGRWAGWWSHPRADGEAWFESYWDALEEATGTASRAVRDVDWGEEVAASGRFQPPAFRSVPWTRQVSVDDWLVDQASHSTLMAMPPDAGNRLLSRLEQILRAAFPSGRMAVPYETWLWIARVTHAPPGLEGDMT
jgi:SAM-dependent methyltransferase